MTVLCPNGHDSTDVEWCDTCGSKIGGEPDAQPAAPVAAPAPPVQVAGPPMPCPHCGASNMADNLFCEECGYDFTTGQRPASPAVTDHAAAAAALTGPAWSVSIAVDPAWFAVKGSLAEQPLPEPTSSMARLDKHVVLVGRSSRSHNAQPDIALDSDTGVSRRHAQFVRDLDTLAVIDLSSTNGTFVVRAGAEIDADIAPLQPGVQATLRDGDRVYVGAWTCLTVHRDEQ